MVKKALLLFALCLWNFPASASKLEAVKDQLVPHKALYDINLISTRSGSQIANISGQMLYEWKPTCEAWVTDHRFNLFYEYADSPGMRITSDFSTYETFDGEEFSYSARRRRNGDLYEELRGKADIKKAKASFSKPSDLSFELPDGSVFPMTHTINMINKAQLEKPIYNNVVFDGSDKDGPVEINAVIGKLVNPMSIVKANESLDMSLVNSKAWKARMAVFPVGDDGALSDYEMSLVFHENGLISDMTIDYDDFSVSQRLVALEKLDENFCVAAAE
ncbi:MAG: DUF1849 family protein [Pseudomonadota bacterium]